MAFLRSNVNAITIERKADNQRWHGDFFITFYSVHFLGIFFLFLASIIRELSE